MFAARGSLRRLRGMVRSLSKRRVFMSMARTIFSMVSMYSSERFR